MNHQQAIDLTQSPGHPSCSGCHDPHGATEHPAQLLRDPATDELCTECHTGIDSATHGNHPVVEGTPTVTCVACHMPRTATSALRYDIASHAMLPIPPEATRPTLEEDQIMPNSCMSAGCHQQADPNKPAMPVYPFGEAGVTAAQDQWDTWYGG
jgi:predicted CXXCH cytochrome family protein